MALRHRMLLVPPGMFHMFCLQRWFRQSPLRPQEVQVVSGYLSLFGPGWHTLWGVLPKPLGWDSTRTSGIVGDGVHRDMLWHSRGRHMAIIGMIHKPPQVILRVLQLFFPDKGQTHVLHQQTMWRPNQKNLSTSIICVTIGAFPYKWAALTRLGLTQCGSLTKNGFAFHYNRATNLKVCL